MISQRPICHMARLTLEALTPHGIHAEGSATHDVLLVRDANGLPTIPATSLIGVLRHHMTRRYNKKMVESLLGFAEDHDEESGQPSWVTATWGVVHDSQNRPIAGLRDDATTDPLLKKLIVDTPIVRQRVRLTERGVAAETGKFDVTLIPAGVRYSHFLTCWSDGLDATETAWRHLLGELYATTFRLGHGTRNGSGAFKVVELRTTRWDLTTPEGRKGFCNRPRKHNEAAVNQWPLANIEKPQEPGLVEYVLNLKAAAGWRIGGGERPLMPSRDGHEPDMLPQAEAVVRWRTEAIWHEREVVIPATAIKGPLAHRVAFHYRRLRRQFVQPNQPLSQPEDCLAVLDLFGYMKDSQADSDLQGHVGRVLIDDVYLGKPSVVSSTTHMHSTIDRYTGGVVGGALYQEEVLWQTPLTLTIRVTEGITLSDDVMKALELALEDLKRGDLPIGACGARGQGILVEVAP